MFKWLFGKTKGNPVKQIIVLYCRNWNEEADLTRNEILKRVNDLSRQYGYNLKDENLIVVDYGDLQDTFVFKENVPILQGRLQQVNQLTDKHVIIMHCSTEQNLFDYAKKLANQFISCMGKQTVTNIAFDDRSKFGWSRVTGKTDPSKIDKDIDVKTDRENFDAIKRLMFEGISS